MEKGRGKGFRRPRPARRHAAWTICVALSLGLQGALAQNQAPNQLTVTGQDFQCDFQPENSRLECKASAGKILKGTQTLSLSEPDRLVIDIPDVRLGPPQSHLVSSSHVARIRCAQRESGARIVLDLIRPVTFVRYDSTEGPSVVSFDLSATAPEPAPTPEPTPRPSVEPTVTPPAVPSDLIMQSEPPVNAVEGLPLRSGVAPKLPAIDLSIPQQALEAENVLLFSVSSTFLSFEPGERPVRDVQVINKTEKELFLRSDVQRVYDSGTPAERYENTKELVSSPKRFALPPLATRAVRLVLAGKPPERGENIYRLILSPEELPEAQVEVEGKVNSQAAHFKVVAGLGVTVALPSAQAEGTVLIEPQINQVMLTNPGTRSVLIENCSACPLKKDTCVSSGRKLLYPQRPWGISVAGSGAITCDIVVGTERRQISSLYNVKEAK